MMEDVKKSIRTSVHGGGGRLRRSLISFGVVLALLIFTIPFIIVNNNKAATPSVVEQTEDTKDIKNIPGVYYASEQEVEESGVAQAPRSEKGGAIYVGAGTVYNMVGGTLKNQVAGYGGAVYVADGGTFNMTGGMILMNQALCGGAIYVENGGTVNLTGGSITGNAADAGAAIYIEEGAKQTTVTTGENFIISGNYNQLYDSYVTFYVDGKFTSVAALDETNNQFDRLAAPLDYEHCNGYFSDADLIHGVEHGETIYTPPTAPVQSAAANNFETVRLYTRTATPSKLTFTLNDDNQTYKVGGGSDGVIVIPREYNGKTVSSLVSIAAFAGARNITEIYLSNTMASIPNSTFDECTGLTKVTIPDSVTSIGSDAFYGCENLANVIIGSSVTGIGSEAFRGCISLTSVALPEGLISIGYFAFSGTGLRSITIPASVTSINGDSFSSNNLTSVYYEGSMADFFGINFTTAAGNPWIWSRDGYTLYIDNVAVTDVVVPNGVTTIPYGIFGSCNITSITIPDTVTSIEMSAFCGCSGLTEVTIPSSVASIGWFAFQLCSNLASVTFENPNGWQLYNNVTDISGADLANVSTAATYLKTTYNDDGWTRNDTNYLTFTPDDANNPTFYSVTKKSGATIAGHMALPSTYNNLPVKSLEAEAFRNCTGLTSVVVPNTVQTFNTNVFYGCTNLQSVIFEAGSLLDTLYPGTFAQCVSLTNIVLPSNLTIIGNYVFSGCSALEEIELPETLNYINLYAFANCSSLESIKIPTNVVVVGNNAFSGCGDLEIVTIDSSTIANLSSSGTALLDNATTVYVKDTITNVGTFITGSFTQTTSDIAGYKKYTKNS